MLIGLAYRSTPVGRNPGNLGIQKSRDFTPFPGILKQGNLEISGINIMKSWESAQKVSAVGNLWFSLECISRESIITPVYPQMDNNS